MPRSSSHGVVIVLACVQHYQKEADGLCTRLRTPVDKEGKRDVCIDLEAFKKGECPEGWGVGCVHCYLLYSWMGYPTEGDTARPAARKRGVWG